MALINCPECSKEISDTVKVCPHCGYKIKKINNHYRKISKSTKKWIVIAAVCCVIIFAIVGIMYAALSLNDAENAQVVSLNNLIAGVIEDDLEDKSETQLSSSKEKCQQIVEEYSELKWKQKRKVDGYKSLEEKISAIDNKISSINQDEIQTVINLINDVGEVTLESKEAIDNAKTEYDKLDEEQKSQVTNYSQIEVYQNKFNEVCLNETILRINNIGKVSLDNDSKKKIEDAETLYNSLPQEIRGNVSNYNTLKSKSEEYSKLDAYKELFVDAQDEMKDGCLNAAKILLKGVPSKFKYNGTKASTLKKQLSSKRAWVALCGRWKTTGGQMRVTQVWDYDGRSQWWYRDFDKGEESISVKCQLLKNGKVKVKISGQLPIYTSYSSIQEGLDTGTVGLNTTKTMSSMGTIKIDSHTTMTLSSSGITVNYNKVNPNEDQYFTYKYKTTMSLKKRAEKY